MGVDVFAYAVPKKDGIKGAKNGIVYKDKFGDKVVAQIESRNEIGYWDGRAGCDLACHLDKNDYDEDCFHEFVKNPSILKLLIFLILFNKTADWEDPNVFNITRHDRKFLKDMVKQRLKGNDIYFEIWW